MGLNGIGATATQGKERQPIKDELQPATRRRQGREITPLIIAKAVGFSGGEIMLPIMPADDKDFVIDQRRPEKGDGGA